MFDSYKIDLFADLRIDRPNKFHNDLKDITIDSIRDYLKDNSITEFIDLFLLYFIPKELDVQARFDKNGSYNSVRTLDINKVRSLLDEINGEIELKKNSSSFYEGF